MSAREPAGAVVRWSQADGVATVVMEDRASKNTFSPALVRGLVDVFAAITAAPALKVVVIHGYDSYFCCGGTQEELLRICAGEVVFTDGDIYDLLLRCPVPVIAAMQGHALGGGLALGAFADVIIVARQCLYGANFMTYGFTPGFGATYILPKKLGETLAREMLFSARSVYGSELQERGANVKVVDKSEVLAVAARLAGELAQKPRLALVELKRQLNREIEAQLPAYIAGELRMHEATVAQPEVRRRIETLYGKG